MSEENISQEFRLKNIDKTRNNFIKEINQNKLMGQKHKKFGKFLNYIEHLLIRTDLLLRSYLIFTFSQCVSISAFASLVGIPIEITSFVKESKLCVRAAGIKKCKSIIN